MGWQNHTEVLRLFLTPEEATHLKGQIKEGRTPANKAWYSIERLVPGANKRNPDNFGPVYASCMSPYKCMTDPMWEGWKAFKSLPYVKEHLRIKKFDSVY